MEKLRPPRQMKARTPKQEIYNKVSEALGLITEAYYYIYARDSKDIKGIKDNECALELLYGAMKNLESFIEDWE